MRINCATAPSKLGVWSRDEVVRVDFERSRVRCPGLADRLEGGSPSQPLQVLSEVVGHDEGEDVGLQALKIRVAAFERLTRFYFHLAVRQAALYAGNVGLLVDIPMMPNVCNVLY